LIDGFLAEAPRLMVQIEQGLAVADAPAVRLAAHSLKTNAADFGAARLHELTVQVETLAKAENLADLPDLVTAMSQAFEQVEAALQQVQREQNQP